MNRSRRTENDDDKQAAVCTAAHSTIYHYPGTIRITIHYPEYNQWWYGRYGCQRKNDKRNWLGCACGMVLPKSDTPDFISTKIQDLNSDLPNANAKHTTVPFFKKTQFGIWVNRKIWTIRCTQSHNTHGGIFWRKKLHYLDQVNLGGAANNHNFKILRALQMMVVLILSYGQRGMWSLFFMPWCRGRMLTI